MTLVETYAKKDQDDNIANIIFDICMDGKKIGDVALIGDYDMADVYIERMDIIDDEQNKGYGTQALKKISEMYDLVYGAPDNEGSQRLLERIGRLYKNQNASYYDQGFGVYQI